MGTENLGKSYPAGEPIVTQGEVGNCMYVIQSGQVEVVQTEGGHEIRLATLGEGDFFGEMSLFEQESRSATVRSLGDARVLTIDKRTFMRRIQEDPSLAFRIVEMMSRRLRNLDTEFVRFRANPEA